MPAVTSINRWPVLRPGDSRLKTAQVPGTDVWLTMRADVLPLFLSLALDYDRLVAPLRKGECGAYNYREARAAAAWSDHSSGTALDLNWGHEGAQGLYGGMATMSTKQIRACAFIKKRFQVVIWGGDKAKGGDYANPRNWDPMHYALREGTTVADVRRVIRELNIQPDGTRHPKYPGAPLRVGSVGAAVRDLRRHLGLPAGDRYDSAAAAAVKAFKRRRPWRWPAADGVCGPVAWRLITAHR